MLKLPDYYDKSIKYIENIEYISKYSISNYLSKHFKNKNGSKNNIAVL